MIAYIPRLIGQLGVGCRIRHATRRFRIAKALMPVGLIVTSSMSLTMPAMAVTLSDELYRALYLDPQISQIKCKRDGSRENWTREGNHLYSIAD